MNPKVLLKVQGWLFAACTPRYLFGASLFRIGAGITLLLLYLVNYPQRNFLYGPDALFPFAFSAADAPWSAYSFSSSQLWFEFVFHAAIVVNICWLLGVVTWLLTPLQAYLTLSLQRRAPGVFDGGDNLIGIVLIYMCCADVSRYFALQPSGATPSFGSRVRGLLHNAALLATALQLSIVYSVAGLSKIMGTQWPGGVALYYALRLGEFYRPGVSEHAYASDALVALGCYVVVALQVCFPLLFFLNRNTRVVALSLSALFHVGIGLVMGLMTFAMFMISVDLAFVGRRERRLLSRLFRFRRGPGDVESFRGTVAAE